MKRGISPNGQRALLFDLDGTLIDSIGLIQDSYQHTLEAHRGAAPPLETFLEGLGRPLRWQFERFTEDPAEVEAMILTYRRFNLEHHDRRILPFPGLTEAIARLAAQRRSLGIVTSKQRAGALRGLSLCGFEHAWFTAVVGADDVKNHKPHPEPVLLACAAIGVHPHQAIMIGDSPHDLASGRAAGTRTAAVSWGPFPESQLRAAQPDFWLSTPMDLHSLLS